MKNLVGILALLIINTSVFANDNKKIEPSLQVMAKSGLKLRLSPNLDAPVLEVIAYGEEVTKTDDYVEARTKLTFNWVEGSWIKVKYKNQVGFVFDGFVSQLEVPQEDAEFASRINDLGFSIYNWAHLNNDLVNSDTLSQTEAALTTLTSLGNHELFVHDTETGSKVELTLSDVRIMDAYHLLESMMDTRSARAVFKENTTFFSGTDGKVNKLKVADGQILISKLDNGSVKISCHSIHEGC